MKRYIFLIFICISVFEFAVAQRDTIKATFTYCAEGKGGLYPDKYQDGYTPRRYYYYTFTYDDILYAVPIEEHGTIFRDWCIVVQNDICIDTISAEEMDIVLSLNSDPRGFRDNIFVPKPPSIGITNSVSSVTLPKYVSLKPKFDYEKLNNLIAYFKIEITTNPRLSTFVNTEPYFYYSKRSTKTRSAEDGIISFDEAFKQIQKDADFRAYYDTVMYQYDIDFLTMLLDDYNARYGITEIEVEITVDKSALQNLISKADSLLTNTQVGTKPEQYGQIEYLSLNFEKKIASTILENENSKQADVDNEVLALSTAIEAYEDSKVEQTAITEIKQTLSISIKDNTIICNVPFQIIDIEGQNVTNLNGNLLSGTYIVVTEQGNQKVVVK